MQCRGGSLSPTGQGFFYEWFASVGLHETMFLFKHTLISNKSQPPLILSWWRGCYLLLSFYYLVYDRIHDSNLQFQHISDYQKNSAQLSYSKGKPTMCLMRNENFTVWTLKALYHVATINSSPIKSYAHHN